MWGMLMLQQFHVALGVQLVIRYILFVPIILLLCFFPHFVCCTQPNQTRQNFRCYSLYGLVRFKCTESWKMKFSLIWGSNAKPKTEPNYICVCARAVTAHIMSVIGVWARDCHGIVGVLSSVTVGNKLISNRCSISSPYLLVLLQDLWDDS